MYRSIAALLPLSQFTSTSANTKLRSIHRDIWRLALPLMAYKLSATLKSGWIQLLSGIFKMLIIRGVGAAAAGDSALSFVYWGIGLLRVGATKLPVQEPWQE